MGRGLLPALPVIHVRSPNCFVIELKTMKHFERVSDEILFAVTESEIDFIFIPASW